MKDEKPRPGNRAQELRTCFLREEEMESRELLELALCYALPRCKDTERLSQTLLERFGSLSGVLRASPEALMMVEGITENTAVLLTLIPYVMNRSRLSSQDPKARLDTTEKLVDYLHPYFYNQRREQVYLLCLDERSRVLNCTHLGVGSDSAVTLDVKSLTAAALRCKAAQVVLAHSHPSGVAVPSQADLHSTRRCRQALHTLGIELVDHLVFADDECVSMRDSNLL